MAKFPMIVFAAFAALVVAWKSAFVVPEGFHAVVTQFGDPKRSVEQAGLHFKTPFMQEVRYLDKRVLSWDGDANQVPTRDQKIILVDATARWRIRDPLLFLRSVVTEANATNRIGAVINAATRNTISSHNLVEAVRSTNQIVNSQEHHKVKPADADLSKASTTDLVNLAVQEISGDLEKVTVGREKLTSMIADAAKAQLDQFGIQLIDVQLMRVAYERSVEQSVFNTMISEQQRIAEKFRSIGKGEQAKIQGTTDLELKTIQSETYRKVQDIRGQAEAEAIKIYAEAIGSNREFYEFLRTSEAYRNGLREDTQMVLSAESRFLQLLVNGMGRAG